MKKIRVMLVDDIPEFIDYFTSGLNNSNDIEVITSVSSGAEAVKCAKELKPDVILMDIQMENDIAGIEATKEILEILPSIKIVALSIHENSNIVIKAFNAGMSDYILKSASIEEIIITIKDCLNKKDFKKISATLASDFSNIKANRKKIMNCFSIISKLSPTEAEILESLCNGLSYKEIAKNRFVEPSSIRSFVTRITTKANIQHINDVISIFNECDFFNFTSDD